MAGKKNPWGKPTGGGSGDTPSGDKSDGSGNDGPRNPWLPGGGSDDGKRRSASIEDIFKNKGPEGPRRAGGGGGGPSFQMPSRPGGGSWLPIILAVLAGIWIIFTSFHFIQPGERATVTRFGGSFVGTFDQGTNISWPYPISIVEVENVEAARIEEVPSKLILTGDQNLVDLSYSVRWNINDLSLFQFQLADPVETVREAAEAAMRSSVAEKTLDTVISGEGRADIQANVQTRMQNILDSYGAGITVLGIEVDQTDPPESVVEAFNDVLAAQQDAERELNGARRYSQRLLARAEGDAEQFNQIYSQYRLAPEVTRRRLYYETMESVLSRTDKTIIDADGVTPYLPLREIERRSAQPAAPAAAPAPAGGQ
ncbi:protease modulator HflK [Erythrobacter sp. SCSIO 43205]|uniref:protease modulator HflK n=1 Tax=Erythrobacter sp. SCSIO 43205 TaxID=2779361 RepID=UPI001CAA1537|nr:protease modulator HflK [Erythrobacter sp. SCSIO 43205]UAB78776.1 protease modulator HflK [Erythrobacter sp. SCSIO 43205]